MNVGVKTPHPHWPLPPLILSPTCFCRGSNRVQGWTWLTKYFHNDNVMSDTHSVGYTKTALCLTLTLEATQRYIYVWHSVGYTMTALCLTLWDTQRQLYVWHSVGYTKTALCLTLYRLHEDSFMSNTHSVGYMMKALCLTHCRLYKDSFMSDTLQATWRQLYVCTW